MKRRANEVHIAKQDEPSMRAAIIEQYGGPDVLKIRTDIVQPQKVEKYFVKVKIIAASVNPIDWKMRSGIKLFSWLLSSSFPKCLGRDFAGIVEEVGPTVTSVQVGDQVYGMTDMVSTYCEYVVCSETWLTKKPTNLTFQEAAVIPLAALTAWQALIDLGKMKTGDKVLVIGGSGGVGNFAVQICRAKGATCYATCGTSNLEFVTSLGASKVIDYRTQDVVRELDKEQFDIVFDTIGIREQRDQFFPFVKRGGTLVTTLPFEGTSLGETLSGLADMVGKNIWFGICHRISYSTVVVKPSHSALDQIRDLVEKGDIKVHVDKEYPLENIREAHEYSEQGRTRGKIAITVSQQN
mmetsp:Transcript_16465/g.22853  ORF Transcript_16465/g.22853 Transcript_16465/m.22853 type:complete len:352 (+) Transcript_16465:107-1162(+)